MSRRRLALLAVAAVLVVLFGGRWVALRYTEHAWFVTLGQGARFNALFLRTILWQAAVFVGALGWYAAHTLGVYGSIGSVHLPRRVGNLDIDEAVPSRTLRAIALGVAALLAAATAYTFGDLGDYVALARHAVPFGLPEPVLHQDTSFYLATLPLLEVLHLLATISVLLASVLVAGLYALTGSFFVSRRHVRITPHARSHLVVLLCGLALVMAWGFHLDAYQLVAGGGHDEGALTGVDRAIRIPAASALAVIALVVAAGSALALRWVRPALLFSLWATLVVAALLGRLVIPVLADAWGAGSDPVLQEELAQLTEDRSRAAFGLLEVPTRRVPALDLRADSGAALEEAVEGVYAWSGEAQIPARLLEAGEGESSRTRAWTISPAVARVGGRVRPALLAISQADFATAMRLVPRPGWTSLHRGVRAWGGEPVMIDAGLRTGALQYLSNLDATDTAPGALPVRRGQARVRFLPGAADLGVVGPDENTFGETAPGVLLGSFPRRLLLAWALQAPPLLDDHTSNADRVIYWRDLPTRLSRLYPFAGFDPARAALIDGRLVWIVDGYVVSSRFPLAQHLRWRGDDINYLAAPYVVTVDAATGRTRLFLRPGAGPFARSVAQSALAEPLPPDSMAPALRRELGYPTALLGAQAATFTRFGRGGQRHVPWSLTSADTVGGRDAALIQPTLALLSLEGPRVQLWQIVPLTDPRGTRLSALVAGSASDAGELQLRLLIPEGPGAITPAAAAARMAATPVVMASAAATGSEAAPHRGRIQVIPAAGSILYAQALYSAAVGASEPARITAVIVLADGRIGLGADARAAARSLLKGDAQSTGLLAGGEELAQARVAFLTLDSAARAGDWERFARAWAALRRALRLEPAPAPRP